jgi:hypothetical protein
VEVRERRAAGVTRVAGGEIVRRAPRRVGSRGGSGIHWKASSCGPRPTARTVLGVRVRMNRWSAPTHADRCCAG